MMVYDFYLSDLEIIFHCLKGLTINLQINQQKATYSSKYSILRTYYELNS